MKKIPSSGYSIFIGDSSGILKELTNFLSRNYSSSEKIVLADEHTKKYCLPAIQNIPQLRKSKLIEIKSGEANKNIDTVIKVWNSLIDLNADRKSLLINIGGGVMGDLGGFAASTFKRGIDFINIPTTLLAQVDASVGGKTGIDFLSGEKAILKNQIGVFNTPKAVFILPDFLKTVNKRQILSGFAEIIKHALIADKIYWKEIKKTQTPGEKIISRSVQIKNEIVLKDPKEEGLRKVLNFGHTVGHAVESFSLKNDKKPLLHGEAIAIGMICEAYLSSKISGLKEKELTDIVLFIRKKYSHYKLEKNNFAKLLALMREDKKNEKGEINFSLLAEIGKCVINQNCSKELIIEALDFYNQRRVS